jgi:hypothetical protein
LKYGLFCRFNHCAVQSCRVARTLPLAMGCMLRSRPRCYA